MNKLVLISLVVALIAATAEAGESDGVFIETGLLAGVAAGVEGQSFSTFRAFTEVGYMWGKKPDPAGGRWGGGATLYLGLGHEDLRLALAPRVRYSFSPDWSLDVSAGYIFATSEGEPGVANTGFLGSLNLNQGGWLTYRAEVNVKEVQPWTTVHQNVPVEHEGGYETSIYGGLAARGRPGWVAAGIGVAAVFALMLLVLASGGGS
jgi:hypothetical protein